MGRYRNTGLAHGTNGSPQMTFDNFRHDKKVKKLETDISLKDGIELLKEKGIKFTEENVMFVVYDDTGQLVWLEKNDENAGLSHICSRHIKDFASKHNIDPDKISDFIKDVITNGVVEYQSIVEKSGHFGYEKIIRYKSQYYFSVAIGTNGFIISVYPRHEADAIRQIWRKKNEKKNH